MLFKRRKAKNSKRGVYLQDFELRNTVFTPGSNYKWIVDVKSNKLFILSSDNPSDNVVSKRKVEDGFKPVIDIRSHEALETFKGCDYLQISIYGDKVVVEGFVQDISQDNGLTTQMNLKQSRVVDITELVKVKKVAQVIMSAKGLRKAVGSEVYEQLSFDSLFSTISDNSIKLQIKKKLKGINVPLQVVSLYSGAGLLDLGFKDNFDIIFGLELSEGACETYRHNIGNHIVCVDITEYDINSIPKAQIIIGGSPCVKFSNSNRTNNLNKKLDTTGRIMDIPENILFRKYVETVKKNGDCMVFVHENVPQILSIGNGRLYEEMKSELPDYEFTAGVVSAADMGSPQLRDRAIIIGSRIGKIELPKPKVLIHRTVRQAFSGLSNDIPNQLDYSISKPSTKLKMGYVPPGGNILDIPKDIRPKGQHSDVYKRLEWDKPSITIVNPRKNSIMPPEGNRILTVRECARLQDVPDDFVFLGTLESKQQQVCNGVPVRLARAVADVVKNAFDNYFLSSEVVTA